MINRSGAKDAECMGYLKTCPDYKHSAEHYFDCRENGGKFFEKK